MKRHTVFATLLVAPIACNTIDTVSFPDDEVNETVHTGGKSNLQSEKPNVDGVGGKPSVLPTESTGGATVATGGRPEESSGGAVASSGGGMVVATSGGGGAIASSGGDGPEAGAPGVGDTCGNGIVELDEQCDDGNSVDDDGCDNLCDARGGVSCESGCPTAPSCVSLNGTECAGGDCCASLLVPGGTVKVYAREEQSVPSFRLDKHEVTVARFRAFMAEADAWAAAGNPLEGAGAHPEVPASGFRREWMDDEITGWFVDGLKPTWLRGYDSETGEFSPVMGGTSPDFVVPGADNVPVNYVPFFVAFAFCIWDGGRLPALVEWERATSKADDARYPWGNTPTTAEIRDGRPAPVVPAPLPDDLAWSYVGIAVGSSPATTGRYGHQDLFTGLHEFLRDAGAGLNVPNPEPMTGGLIELGSDTVPLTVQNLAYTRFITLGDWLTPEDRTSRGQSAVVLDGTGFSDIGFRCARDL